MILVQTPWTVVETMNDKMFFGKLLEDIGAKQIPGFVGNANSVIGRLSHSDGEDVIVRGSTGGRCYTRWACRPGIRYAS